MRVSRTNEVDGPTDKSESLLGGREGGFDFTHNPDLSILLLN